MVGIIACDLDETLLQTWDKRVSQRNRAAIAQATERGVKFVLATGRPWSTVQGTLEELGLRGKPGEYVISYNGGVITENAGNRVLYHQGITFEEAETLFERAKQYDVGMHVYTKDHIFVWRLDSFGEREFQSGRMEVEERFDTSLDFLRGEDILKVLYINTDYDYLHRIEAELSDVTGNLDVSYSSNRFLEFNRKGVNKGDGLIRLARLLDVPIADTVAIGDNFNDLPMIQAAGLGVGVANSVQGILPYCNLVTSADCDHDAVAEVIERFLPQCGQ